jgi:hypothetical protein
MLQHETRGTSALCFTDERCGAGQGVVLSANLHLFSEITSTTISIHSGGKRLKRN